MSASNIIEYPLIKSSATVVGTTDWDELDRELTLGPGNDQHPSVRQLFDYLMNPKCTGEEFSYVIGELAFEVSGESMYLTKVAAETLAVRSPVLNGFVGGGCLDPALRKSIQWETGVWCCI